MSSIKRSSEGYIPIQPNDGQGGKNCGKVVGSKEQGGKVGSGKEQGGKVGGAMKKKMSAPGRVSYLHESDSFMLEKDPG